MAKEKKDWVQIMLRLEVNDAHRIDDAAHAARLPLGVFIRQLLITGHAPKSAPPASNELSSRAADLLKVCYGLQSNLTQVHGHAARLGGNLTRLTGADGALEKMMVTVQKHGLRAKSGALDADKAFQILVSLEPAAQALNADLSRPLNEGREVSLEVWKRVLSNLQAALLSPSEEVTT